MDTNNLLPKYLDIGVEEEEMKVITLMALQGRLKQLKVAIAEMILQAQASLFMDNLEGQNVSLKQARKLKKEYHHFYAEYRRLMGDEVSPLDDEDDG